MREPRRPLRIAHRGDWRHAPENSVAALLAAVEIPGCDGVEFDVRAAVDGTPVLLHDATLRRVQGRPGRVDQLDVASLGELGIPTLADALAALPRDAYLDIELKGDPGPRVVEVIEEHRGQGHGLAAAIVSSFEADTVARIRAERPHWPCWLNADDLSARTLGLAASLGCAGVATRWQSVNERSLGRAGSLGLRVLAYTVRDAALFDRLAQLDLTAVCVEGAALDG